MTPSASPLREQLEFAGTDALLRDELKKKGFTMETAPAVVLEKSRSEISEEASIDHYRLGKSLRKKGFDVAGFLADLPARATELNEALRGLLATPAPIQLPVPPATEPTSKP